MLGNIAFLDLYLQAKGDLSIVDQRGRSALHYCVANGHKQVTTMLCELGQFANLLELADFAGNTPLHSAIKYNQVSSLKVLIQFGADLWHRNNRGDTCLHTAALYDSQECLVVLTSFATDELFDARNRDGLLAIDIAASLQYAAIESVLERMQRNLMTSNAINQRDFDGGRVSRGRVSLGAGRPLGGMDVERSVSEDEALEESLEYSRHKDRVIAETEEQRDELRAQRWLRHNQPPAVSQRNERTELHVSSSRIQESYFDDEMQARVRRSRRSQSHVEGSTFVRPSTARPGPTQTSLVDRIAIGVYRVVTDSYRKLVDYIWTDDRPIRRNQVAPMPFMPEPPLNTSLVNHRSSSQHGSRHESSYFDFDGPSLQRLSNSSSDFEYRTAYSRSKSRAPQTREAVSPPRRVQFVTEPPKEETPEQHSISVQADPIPLVKPQEDKKKRNGAKQVKAKRSVGVGSIRIDESLPVENDTSANSAKKAQAPAPKKRFLSQEDHQRNSKTTTADSQQSPKNAPPALARFYQKMAEHDQMSMTSREEKKERREYTRLDIAFDPDEQDEENYQHQNQNFNYFDKSSTEEAFMADLDLDHLNSVSKCSFQSQLVDLCPRMNSQMSINLLDRGQFVHNNSVASAGRQSMSSLNLKPVQQQTPSRQIFAPKVLAPLTAYQSDGELASKKTHVAKPDKLSIKPLRAPVPKPAAAANIDLIQLFCDDSEHQHLQQQSEAPPYDKDGNKSQLSDISDHVFKGDHTKITTLFAQTANRNSKDAKPTKSGTRYLDSANDSTLLGFDLTTSYHNEPSSRQQIHQQPQSKQENSKPRSMSKQKSLKAARGQFEELFPPANLDPLKLETDFRLSYNALEQTRKQSQSPHNSLGTTPQNKRLSIGVKASEILKELEQISNLESDRQNKPTTNVPAIPQSKQLEASPSPSPKPILSASPVGTKLQSLLYASAPAAAKPGPQVDPGAQSGPDEEAVLINPDSARQGMTTIQETRASAYSRDGLRRANEAAKRAAIASLSGDEAAGVTPSDRLKRSLQAFKGNKLIGASGIGTGVRQSALNVKTAAAASVATMAGGSGTKASIVIKQIKK